jgi:hypothetical protein
VVVGVALEELLLALVVAVVVAELVGFVLALASL